MPFIEFQHLSFYLLLYLIFLYLYHITSDVCILKQNTKQSLKTVWSNYLSHDWMPEEKARSFSVQRFYVDLKWTKIEKNVFKSIQKDIRGILDILREAGTTGQKILVEGKFN